MKIAVYYPKTSLGGWSETEGLLGGLRRLGHDPVACPVPPIQGEVPQAVVDNVKRSLPTFAALKELDAVLISGPEHIGPWLGAIYGMYEWQRELSTPKLGLYHESMWREDMSFGDMWDQIRVWSDEHFFPAVQDAEFYDQKHLEKGRSHFLPFAVDTQVFRPRPPHVHVGDEVYAAKNGRGPSGLACKDLNCRGMREPQIYETGFLGSVYGKRASFLNALARHDIPPLQIGGVQIKDLSGPCLEEQAQRNARNIRQCKVFLNLPSLSHLMVNKVWEVLACGTFLMTPILDPQRGAARNQQLFENGKHLMYYRAANTAGLASELRKWVSEERAAEREAIARAGCELVHREHTLEKRLEKVLATVSKPLVLEAAR